MTTNMRRVLIGSLIVFSLVCAAGFACMLGSILHAGSQAVASGPETATFPSSTGWIATVLMLVGTWLGGSWAKWLAMAAKAVPVVTGVIERVQTGTQSEVAQLKRQGIEAEVSPNRARTPDTPTPSPVNSHETLLSALLTTLEITSGEHVHSEGKHSLGGGTISWAVDFVPGHAIPAAKDPALIDGLEA